MDKITQEFFSKFENSSLASIDINILEAVSQELDSLVLSCSHSVGQYSNSDIPDYQESISQIISKYNLQDSYFQYFTVFLLLRMHSYTATVFSSYFSSVGKPLFDYAARLALESENDISYNSIVPKFIDLVWGNSIVILPMILLLDSLLLLGAEGKYIVYMFLLSLSIRYFELDNTSKLIQEVYTIVANECSNIDLNKVFFLYQFVLFKQAKEQLLLVSSKEQENTENSYSSDMHSKGDKEDKIIN